MFVGLTSLVFVLTTANCTQYEAGIAVELWVGGAEGDTNEALVVIESIELLRCESTWDLRDLVRPSVARAHQLSTPLRSGETRVTNLGDHSPVLYDVLEPPPGQYCGLRLVIGNADSDALGLDQYPSAEGLSLSFRGAPAGGPRITATSRTDFELTFDAPIDLGDASDIGIIELRADLDAWTADLDFTRNQGLIARDLLVRLPSALDAEASVQ